MRYFDLIETPKTGRTFLEAATGRIRQDDERVICWFQPLPVGYQRAYDENGFPFNELIPVLEPCIETCRNAKLAEMRKECGDRIVAGFDSDALGYECHYRNTEHDQLDMQKAMLLDGGKIWRNEKLTLHTKSQALIVYTESSNEIDRRKTTYDERCVYINDPERTIEEINAVTWDSND